MSTPDGGRQRAGASQGGRTGRKGASEDVRSRTGDSDSPLKPHRLIFEQETHEALGELQRPAAGLIASGLVAGFGIGLGVLSAAVVLAHMEGAAENLFGRFLLANALAIGFIVVIMAHTDLYTEYTTIALFPVLTGQASVSSLARLWLLIYLANLVGTAVFAGCLVVLGPRLGVFDPAAAAGMGERLAAHGPFTIILSAFLAGWLMGLLSWLITASRETVSQILMIWLVTGAIAFAHLHHAVSVSIEGFLALFASGGLSAAAFAHALAWTTLGNALGGIVFAVMIRYSVLLARDEAA
jgi:formate-nitrite transporter family protein